MQRMDVCGNRTHVGPSTLVGRAPQSYFRDGFPEKGVTFVSQKRTNDWIDSIVGFGIILGTAIGATIGMIVAGGAGLALGGAFGGAAGVVLGAIARSFLSSRD